MDLFSNLKSFLKTSGTVIDNNIFSLHYKATTITLLGFSILVSARQYFGDPIDCISDKTMAAPILDNFCWVHSTFSVVHAWKKEVGVEVIYPGVDKFVKGDERVFHAYYQWVCFVLFFQSILFYVPRYYWKAVEGGRMKNLILKLNDPCLDEKTKTPNKELLVEYLMGNLNHHSTYVISYIFAELLNFINVIGQMYLIDLFLGGEFSKYGVKVLQFSGWDGDIRYDPMIQVFPRITKCKFHKYGSSGDLEKIDALCILPINILNEKIFIFIWFWFIILAVMSGLVLIYRIVLLFWPASRFMVTSCRSRLVKSDDLRTVLSRCWLGDWFILDLLAKNLDSLNFRDVVSHFAARLEGKKGDYSFP